MLFILTSLLLSQPVYETIVSAARTDTPQDELPLASTVVEGSDLGDGRRALTLAEALASVPSVFASDTANFAQDLRVSIRGFGARAAFGVRGVTVIMDGIPLTFADGQTQLDVLEPTRVARIEVLRGPAAALYGNAAGGVIVITTRDGGEEHRQRGASTHGAWKLWRLEADASGPLSRSAHYDLGFTRLESDGFRAQGRVLQASAHAALILPLDDDASLRWTATYLDAPISQDPGALTRAEVRRDRRAAAPNNLRFAAGEAVRQLQTGATLRSRLTTFNTTEASAWAVTRSFNGSVPFRKVELERDAVGGSGVWSWTRPLLGLRQRLSVGGDVQRQRDLRLNLTNDDGRPADPLLLSQREGALALGLFAQEQVAPAEWLSVLAGARWDRITYELRDRLHRDGDASGERTFQELSTMLGVNVAPSDGTTVYANLSQAFEAPSLTELSARPGGAAGFAPLSPERSESVEVGGRARWGIGRAELALFATRTRDELVPSVDATNLTTYANSGRSRRLGGEAALVIDPTSTVRVRAAYALLDARFVDYVRDGQDLAGNAVPGVPKHLASAAARWAPEGLPFVAADAQYVEHVFTDDLNSATSRSYVVVDARTGWTVVPAEPVSLEIALGVKNLLDQRYSDNVRVNAAGGRSFEPAEPRSFYVTVAVELSSSTRPYETSESPPLPPSSSPGAAAHTACPCRTARR